MILKLLRQQQGKTKPGKKNPINLNKLKHGIDRKIQAILFYLQNEQPNINPNKVTKQEHSAQVSCDSSRLSQNLLEINSKLENISTTIHARMSRDYEDGEENYAEPMFAGIKERNSYHHDEDERIALNQYRNVMDLRTRASQPIQSCLLYSFKEGEPIGQMPSRQEQNQKDQQYQQHFEQYYIQQSEEVISSTPVKFISEIVHVQDHFSQDSDQSLSKRNIQESVDNKIFGIPLTSSIGNNIVIMENLDLNGSKSSNVVISSIKMVTSGKNTSRSLKKSLNKQNKQQKQSPFPQLQRSKQTKRGDKKTPYRATPHKSPLSLNCSGTKKLLQLFAGQDRDTKIITQQMILNMRDQIEEVAKKSRREAQDNNVRIKLLKRIQGCRSSKGQFLAK